MYQTFNAVLMGNLVLNDFLGWHRLNGLKYYVGEVLRITGSVIRLLWSSQLPVPVNLRSEMYLPRSRPDLENVQCAYLWWVIVKIECGQLSWNPN